MAAYTHLTIDADVQTLPEWVDAYNLLVTDINDAGLRLGASLVGNGAASVLSIANTDFQVGNSTGRVVLYGNGHAYVSGDLTVDGTIVGASIGVVNANTTANGLVSITTQSFAGDKTFTQNVALQGTTTANLVVATSITANGALLASLNASALATGTVPTARLSGDYSINVAAVSVTDTRAVSDTPQTRSAGVSFDFKQNGANGLSDGGSYNGVMTFRQYGATADWSGGLSHQLGFTDNGNVWQRSGQSTSWGAWKLLLDSSNYTSYAPSGAGITLNLGALIASSPSSVLGGSDGVTVNRYDTASLSVGSASTATSVTGNINGASWAMFSVQGAVDGGTTRGIRMWDVSNSDWAIYTSTSGAGKTVAGTTAPAGLAAGRTDHHLRMRASATTTTGFLWENSSDATLMSLTSDTGNLSLLGSVYTNGWFRTYGAAGLYSETYGVGIYPAAGAGGTYGHMTTYGAGYNGWSGWGIGTRYTFMASGDFVGIHDVSNSWVLYHDASVPKTQMRGYVYPDTDGTRTLGVAGARWGDIYSNVAPDSASAETKTGALVSSTSGRFYYTTSSRRYKTDILPLDERVYRRWLQVEPITYRANVANSLTEVGFVAEQLDALGFSELLFYKDGLPESLKYDRVVVYLTALVQEQERRIAALEARVSGV